MSTLINIAKGDVVFIDDREHTFCKLVENESGDMDVPDDLQFEDVRNGRLRIYTHEEFDELYLAGKLRWKKHFARKEDDRPEEHCDDSMLRTIRMRFVTAFDAEPVPKTDSALSILYETIVTELSKSDPAYASDKWKRSGGSLRRWLNERGEPGNRLRKSMGDRRHRGRKEMRINPIVLKVLEEKAERYWDNIRVTAKDIYADVRLAMKHINDTRAAQALPATPVPGRTTVWRYLTSHTDYDKSRRRFGKRIAERMFKPLKGSLEAPHILDVAIMDHSWADCHVVDDVNNVPVGRPYISILMDVHSRYPLSHIIGFTPPSVETAMACLRSAVRPKVWLKEQFPDIQGNWIAYGVPRTVLVDNGWEFSGVSFKDACEDAGISVEWAPVRTPEYKGIVERFFRTLNQLIIHKIKGSVPFSTVRLRELGLDPSAEAVILLSELEELICQAIIEVYGREYHRSLKASPEQTWLADQNTVGIDYATDLRALDLSLGKMGPSRKLTTSGIEFKGLTYRSEQVYELLNELLPYAPKRVRSTRGVHVKFKYWPEDISKIAVWSEAHKRYIELPCTDQKYTVGLSEHHHKVLTDYAKDQHLQFTTEDERCAARARLNQKISSFIAAQKIGDRRRAQRILDEGRYIPDETVAAPPLPDSSVITPIETVRNRADGHQAEHAPVRKSAKTAVKKRQQEESTIPEAATPMLKPPVTNPFAAFKPADYL